MTTGLLLAFFIKLINCRPLDNFVNLTNIYCREKSVDEIFALGFQIIFIHKSKSKTTDVYLHMFRLVYP